MSRLRRAMRSTTLYEFDRDLLLELLEHPEFHELDVTSHGLIYELHGRGAEAWLVRMRTRNYAEIYESLDWITRKQVRDEEIYG